jgi:RND family efflux transporter MFP subunit
MVFSASLLAVMAGLGVAAMNGRGPFPARSSEPRHEADGDPRRQATLVRIATVQPAGSAERSFTGVVAARVQSDLGFRVPGKVVQRLVDVGQTVQAGDALARLDAKDLGLALTARRNAVVAARAAATQAAADDIRYRQLLGQGWVSRQKYEATRAALDTARAQLAAAEAEAEVAQNESGYAVLRADADGVVMQVLAEPGQVVTAGQTVIRLAHAGPREAAIDLPESFRPAIGSPAQALVYGASGPPSPSRLRQLSDAADPASRTYEARFVLEGDAARTPLGATVTLRIPAGSDGAQSTVPIGALHDDGHRTGVWVLDPAISVVSFRPVTVRRLGAEEAVVEGLRAGEEVAALGAHLLHEGERIRTAPLAVATP